MCIVLIETHMCTLRLYRTMTISIDLSFYQVHRQERVCYLVNTPKLRLNYTNYIMDTSDSTWKMDQLRKICRARTPTKKFFFGFSFYWPTSISYPLATLTPNLSG